MQTMIRTRVSGCFNTSYPPRGLPAGLDGTPYTQAATIRNTRKGGGVTVVVVGSGGWHNVPAFIFIPNTEVKLLLEEK